MCDQEIRIKRLEEEVAWLRRDITNLISTIDELQKVEFHTHYTKIIENIICTECDN
jgi:hypothetical protein